MDFQLAWRFESSRFLFGFLTLLLALVQPDEINGRETKNTNLIVSDCAPIYATATAACAEIVSELAEMPYVGTSTCRDPEGHLWSIGEYNRPYGQSMRNRLRMN